MTAPLVWLMDSNMVSEMMRPHHNAFGMVSHLP